MRCRDVLSLFDGFAVMGRMAHNQVEGDSGGDDGEDAADNEAHGVEGDAIVPEGGLLDCE